MKIEKLERRVPIEMVKFDGTRDHGREIVQWLNETHGHHAIMRETFKPGRVGNDGKSSEYDEILVIDIGRGADITIGDVIVFDDRELLLMSEREFGKYCDERGVRALPVNIVFKEYTQRIEEGRATLGGEHVYFARLAEVTPDNLAYAYELTGENIRAGDYVNWWCDKFSRLSKNDFEGTFTCPTVSTIEQPDFNG